MNSNKINCQIVSILLNDNNEFANKYTSFINGKFDYNSILEDYFKNKNMRYIKIDKGNQSICFTGQKDRVSFYNQSAKKNEFYFEEIHIHCNDLTNFDNFVNYLENSAYSHSIDVVDSIPHFSSIRDNLKSSELIIEPMTNEVSTTKSLVTLLSQRSDETIFRALAIHFCKLADSSKDINSELIHSLNDIYNKNVVDNEDLFFSSSIADKLVNINNKETDYRRNISKIPTKNINLGNDDYTITIDDENKYEM